MTYDVSIFEPLSLVVVEESDKKENGCILFSLLCYTLYLVSIIGTYFIYNFQAGEISARATLSTFTFSPPSLLRKTFSDLAL